MPVLSTATSNYILDKRFANPNIEELLKNKEVYTIKKMRDAIYKFLPLIEGCTYIYEKTTVRQGIRDDYKEIVNEKRPVVFLGETKHSIFRFQPERGKELDFCLHQMFELVTSYQLY